MVPPFFADLHVTLLELGTIYDIVGFLIRKYNCEKIFSIVFAVIIFVLFLGASLAHNKGRKKQKTYNIFNIKMPDNISKEEVFINDYTEQNVRDAFKSAG